MPVHTRSERAKKNVKRGPKGRIVRKRLKISAVVNPPKRKK